MELENKALDNQAKKIENAKKTAEALREVAEAVSIIRQKGENVHFELMTESLLAQIGAKKEELEK